MRSDQLRSGAALSCGCFAAEYQAVQGRTQRNRTTADERREAKRQLAEMRAWVQQARQASVETAAQATSARMSAASVKRQAKARRAAEYRAAHPPIPPNLRKRHATLRKNYGTTVFAFQEKLAAQGGGCAICGEPLGISGHQDHCHATGAVRGVLCNACNSGLGMFRDSVPRLAKAIAYLAQYGGLSTSTDIVSPSVNLSHETC